MLIIEHAKSEMKNGLRPRSFYQKKKFPEQYFEFHHVLPKSLYPNWSKRKSNLVALTAREHFFCHQLLDKIYPNTNMFFALWRLANDGQNKYCIKNSRTYEILRIKASILSKSKTWKPTEQQLQNMRDGCRKRDTPEYRKKLSNSLKGKKFSEERKQHIGIALKGKPSPFKGIKKVVSPKDLPSVEIKNVEDFEQIKNHQHIFYKCKICGSTYYINNYCKIKTRKDMLCYTCFRRKNENKC